MTLQLDQLVIFFFILFCWHAMPRLLNLVCWMHKSRSVPIPGSAENGLRAELEPGFIRKAWGRQKNTHTHTHRDTHTHTRVRNTQAVLRGDIELVRLLCSRSEWTPECQVFSECVTVRKVKESSIEIIDLALPFYASAATGRKGVTPAQPGVAQLYFG